MTTPDEELINSLKQKIEQLQNSQSVSQTDIVEIVAMFNEASSVSTNEVLYQAVRFWSELSKNDKVLVAVHPYIQLTLLEIVDKLKQYEAAGIGATDEEKKARSLTPFTSCLSSSLNLKSGDICQIRSNYANVWKKPPNAVFRVGHLNSMIPIKDGDKVVYLGEVEVEQNFPVGYEHLINKYLVSKWLLVESTKIGYCHIQSNVHNFIKKVKM